MGVCKVRRSDGNFCFDQRKHFKHSQNEICEQGLIKTAHKLHHEPKQIEVTCDYSLMRAVVS